MSKELTKPTGADITVVAPETTEMFQALEKQTAMIAVMEPGMTKSFHVASLIKNYQVAMDQPGVMDVFMGFQNNPLGFRTDSKKGSEYPPSIVRDCIIQAMMMGVTPIGNQFNIIAARAYLTKEGCQHKLDKMMEAGKLDSYYLDSQEFLGFDKSTQTAKIRTVVSWSSGGKKHSHDIIVCPKFDFKRDYKTGKPTDEVSSSLDQLYGKAKRKALAWLIERVSGEHISEGDATEEDYIDTTASVVTPDQEEDASADRVEYMWALVRELRKHDFDLSDKFEEKAKNGDTAASAIEKGISWLIGAIRKAGGVPPTVAQSKSTGSENENKKEKKPSAAQLKRFNTFGSRKFGADWDSRRAEVCKIVSDGQKESSKDLNSEELASAMQMVEED